MSSTTSRTAIAAQYAIVRWREGVRQGQSFTGLLDRQTGCGIIPKAFMGTAETRELLPGTLDMMILKVLSRGEMHGYGIASAIQHASDDVLGVVEGALYPALHRLEVRGWVRAKWGTSDNNRRAKFYRLSALGRRALDEEAAYWHRVAAAVTRVMQSA
jgi:PadR family transcriptional regulator, regulatory protein PadR